MIGLKKANAENQKSSDKQARPYVKNILIVEAFIVVALVGVLIGSNVLPGRATGLTALAGANTDTGANTIDKDALSAKVESYINNNLLAAGTTAKVTDIKDEGETLYLFSVDLYQGGEVVQSASLPVTKTGDRLILGNVLDLDNPLPKTETQPTEPQTFEKTAKPKLEMFVMSFCPYGLQAEQGLKPVAELLGDSAEIIPRYVVYGSSGYAGKEATYCIGDYCSMHGINELKEDIRQMCIYKNEPDKFWAYVGYIFNSSNGVSSTNIEEKWKDAATAAGVDIAKVEACFASDSEALLAENKTYVDQYSVGGSPTIILNGTDYSGGREPNSYKEAICSAFTEVPEACGTVLAATGTDATASGDCGA